MKFEILFLTLSLTIQVSGQLCSNPTIRQEWRQLSEPQKQKYLAAAQALKARSFGGDETADMSTWNHDMFSQIHWKYQQNNHGKPAFLPWHRKYINGYEKALQSIDPTVVLPYWDWRLDSQRPAGSDMFLAQHFGGNGDPANNNCVPNGVAAGWISVQGPNNGQCLKRCNNWQVLFSPESVAALIGGASDYNTFYSSIEGGPHANVHNQMGGSCGDISSMASSNDPVFFLHHAMVDKTWWLWQHSCAAFSQLGPINGDYPPYGQINAFSTTNNGFCYTYSQSAGDAPYTMNCPSIQVNPFGGPMPNTTKGTNTSVITTPSLGNAWLQNAILLLVPGHSISKLVQNNMAAVNTLHKREFITTPATTTKNTTEEFCHWWGNIKCATYAPDSYLLMMGMTEDQIILINQLKPVTCGAVKEINADPTRNSTASLMYFQQHNPHWVPPKSCD